MAGNEELLLDDYPEGQQKLSMLPSIFTPFPGVSPSPVVPPVDDAERIQIMLTNIEQQQMAVRANMLSLIGRRQKILDWELERLMDQDEDGKDAGRELERREMLFKARMPATVPKDHEIGKDELVRGASTARYEAYELKLEDLSDIKSTPHILERSSRRKSGGDADGDVEMGGMDQTLQLSVPNIQRTRRELGEEIMDLMDDGLQGLEEFDKVAKQVVDKLKKSLLEKKK